MKDSQFGLNRQSLIDILEKHALSSAGLVEKSGGSTVVKSAADFYYFINGKLYVLAAGDMAALAGTITDGYYNVYVFTVDAAGTVTTTMGTEAVALEDVVFPTTPVDEVIIGFAIIRTVGAAFIGGTTALNAGTVTDTYVNAIAPMRFK